MFKKNLEYINNESLKRRLQAISDYESRTGISYCMSKSNDYVLLKDDVPIDDLQNPREAVCKNFEANIKSNLRPTDTLVIFGILFPSALYSVY